jgi:hypothetical protein
MFDEKIFCVWEIFWKESVFFLFFERVVVEKRNIFGLKRF